MTELNEQQRAEILDAIKAGRKIEAIKLYRDATGAGLKEAKEFIEELTAQLLEEDPNAIQSSGSGCATAVLMMTVSLGIGYFWVTFS